VQLFGWAEPHELGAGLVLYRDVAGRRVEGVAGPEYLITVGVPSRGWGRCCRGMGSSMSGVKARGETISPILYGNLQSTASGAEGGACKES
jgi:hypothetical protein